MKEVEATIKGLTGLLMDKLDVEDIINPPGQVKKHTEASLKAMADRGLYRNADGLYIPSRNVKKCLIGGAKMGRITLGQRRNLYPFIEASVFIQPTEIPLGKKEPDNYIQFAMRRKDGNVIPKRLPICLNWTLNFTLLIYDDDIVDKVHEAAIVAGMSVGLGNGRPDYGRFEVTKWKA